MEKENINEVQCQIESVNQANIAIPEATENNKGPIRKKLPGKCSAHVMFKEDNQYELTIADEYSGCLLQDLTGTKDKELAEEIFLRAVDAMPRRNKNDHTINSTLQALADNTPKDSTEAKLHMQSTVLYAQGMHQLKRAEISTRVDHSESHIRNAIKLLRLHNETIEALTKYRKGGDQRIVVQHVQVNNGGQAIVGSTLNTGGGVGKNLGGTP